MESSGQLKPKPIDRWLGLVGGIVLPVLLYLFPKTPTVVTILLVLIFVALLHPIWNFWWIEDERPRQITSVVILAVVLLVVGFSVPMDEHQKNLNADGHAIRR